MYFDTTDTAKNLSDFKRGDVVKMYKESARLEFPCVVLSCDRIEVFRVEALKGLLVSKTLMQNEGNDIYYVYIYMQGQLVQIGAIPKTRFRHLLTSKVFHTFEKKVHLDENTTITGDLMYALCTV